MQHDRFGDSIRSKLKDYPTPVDTRDLKKRIARKRQQAADQNNHKRSWRILLLLAIIGFGGTLLWKSHFSAADPVFQNHKPQVKATLTTLSTTSRESGKKESTSALPLKNQKSAAASANNLLYSSKKIDSRVPKAIPLEQARASVEKKTEVGRNPEVKAQNDFSEVRSVSPLDQLPDKLFDLTVSNKYIPEIPIPGLLEESFSEKKITGSFTAYFSSGQAFKKLSGPAKEYIDQRKATESPLETWAFDFLYTLHTPSGIEFTTGLSYQRTTEKLLWQNSQSTLIKRDGQFYQQNILRKKIHYNSLEYIDLPVLIGYRQVQRSWLWGAQAGVFFNLQQKAKGKILAPDLEPGHFVALDEMLLKKQIAPAVAAKLIMGYRLSSGITLLVEPGIKWQTRSINTSDYSIDQRYSFAQIGIGLNWPIRL